MYDYTGSDYSYYGICCKPGVQSPICSQTNDWNARLACSPPVIDDGSYP